MKNWANLSLLFWFYTAALRFMSRWERMNKAFPIKHQTFLCCLSFSSFEFEFPLCIYSGLSLVAVYNCLEMVFDFCSFLAWGTVAFLYFQHVSKMQLRDFTLSLLMMRSWAELCEYFIFLFIRLILLWGGDRCSC